MSTILPHSRPIRNDGKLMVTQTNLGKFCTVLHRMNNKKRQPKEG